MLYSELQIVILKVAMRDCKDSQRNAERVNTVFLSGLFTTLSTDKEQDRAEVLGREVRRHADHPQTGRARAELVELQRVLLRNAGPPCLGWRASLKKSKSHKASQCSCV
jgi:hypothetical protein